MVPAFSKLALEWTNHDHGVVAAIDCSQQDSKDLCSKSLHGFSISSFPTILYGDPQKPAVYYGA
jgi:hypothetical protein